MQTDVLDIFSPQTKSWFSSSVGEPTPVQREAWPVIADGSHVLVSAPTGTGKTLSAFLVFIDQFTSLLSQKKLKNELRLIYISPLKSLAGDIRENLFRPLYGIGGGSEAITASVRTGDTTSSERRRMLKTPPNILITTPESLYLLLTSLHGRKMLKTARAIIVDELHALIGSKRGAHLTLSMARLDSLCGRPLQRIGLSATIDPLPEAARYLSGGLEEVKIIAPEMKKDVEIAVTSPLPDMHALPNGTIWPELARSVYERCDGARSVIAFVEGRMYAEKLAYYVNAIAGEGFARTHHGCVSKEQRRKAEDELRSGKLRLLCATSSMELGIDVGEIDRVLQIAYPRSISSLMQRLGRAGHNPGRVSVMHMFPRTAPEGLYCGLTARVATDRQIEKLKTPRLCFDVLAQHLVSMAAGDGYTVGDAMETLSRAYPFREVTEDDVKSILQMLAGDYEHSRDIPVRPRILYDRVNGRVEGDAYSRMLAVSTGGTIPDTGMFTCKTETNVKLGELDEEFVFEARVGDKFLLGSFAWKITKIEKDSVIVSQSTPEGAQPPFWKNVWLSRKYETALIFGGHMRSLSAAGDEDSVLKILRSFGLDEAAAVNASEFVMRQLDATSVLPDDRTIIVEHFNDEAGENQLMAHSIFGRQVNAPLSILFQEAAKRIINTDVGCYEDDDGILLMNNTKRAFPEKILQSIDPDAARDTLASILPSTALFIMTFRYNAARALMMGVRKGKRQPLWIQRLRGTELLDSVIKFDDHPLIRETKRECLEDYWDLPALEEVLNGIRDGRIKIRELHRTNPSPMSLPLRRAAEGTLLYEYTPTTTAINEAAKDALKGMQLIKPAAAQLAKVSERRGAPEDERALHSLLMIEGDLIAGELDAPAEWFEALAAQNRALYIEPGLWIAAEHAAEYEAALVNDDFTEQLRIVRRMLRYRGATNAEQTAGRYFWPEEKAAAILYELTQSGSAVCDDGAYYHADLYERARRETVSFRRRQIATAPPERYAALLAGRASADGRLDKEIGLLCDRTFPPQAWESILLPTRAANYRPAMLDALLSNGEFFWKLTNDGGQYGLSFHRREDVDWRADASKPSEGLSGDEKLIYDTLLKRGASFITGMSAVLEGRPSHDSLISLVGKGLVHADSFVPVRQWLDRDRTQKASVRRKVNSRVMTMTSGRFDITRPLKNLSVEERLGRAFGSAVILCRETARELNVPWAAALEKLRVWEYTGQARRGYFAEGLSGAQFIREEDFAGAAFALENPGKNVVWLQAVDPLQAWGRYLPHAAGKNFICVAGTAVALRGGAPVALFEKQGQSLRVFDYEYLQDALAAFASCYAKKTIYPAQRKIAVKTYPPEAAPALAEAGFTKIAMDYVIYR